MSDPAWGFETWMMVSLPLSPRTIGKFADVVVSPSPTKAATPPGVAALLANRAERVEASDTVDVALKVTVAVGVAVAETVTVLVEVGVLETVTVGVRVVVA